MKNIILSTAIFLVGNLQAAVPIIGEFETSNPDHISGWACINGNPRNVHVHVYSGNGEFIGGTVANSYRPMPWANFCGNNSYVQWNITIPRSFWNGTTRELRAYAIDADGTGDVSELRSSPKIVTFPSSPGNYYNSIFDHRNGLATSSNIDQFITTLDQPVPNGYYISMNYLNPFGSQSADKTPISGDKYQITSNLIYTNSPAEYSQFQRGLADVPGATFAQAQGVNNGMYLDTSKQPTVTGSANINFGERFNQPLQIFQNGSKLITSFEAAIPVSTFDAANSAIGAVGFAYEFVDKNNPSKWFYYSQYMYDPRGFTDTYSFADSGYTDMPIVGQKFTSATSQFGTLGPQSMTFTHLTFSDFRHYQWSLDINQFQNVLNAIDPAYNFSKTPSDYVVRAWGTGPEASQRNGKNSSIGFGIRNIQIYSSN
ncbi:hypothetical protein KDK82_1867 [Delftia sp. K82]|uniref:hypothetical protein n=1 Tax=Delftia sp. K82 TaxID=1472718 RepID=UPI000B6A2DDB|nr:hypothetical protein [Delftia sp. K82]OWG18388.1 hypothetical protein KDK82_1867 [Delftia sp. K82]